MPTQKNNDKIVRNIFRQFDFIATPTSGALPTRIHPNDHICKTCFFFLIVSLTITLGGVVNITESLRHCLYSKLANFTGIPAITVPNGPQGHLPMGIQLMSSWVGIFQIFFA